MNLYEFNKKFKAGRGIIPKVNSKYSNKELIMLKESTFKETLYNEWIEAHHGKELIISKIIEIGDNLTNTILELRRRNDQFITLQCYVFELEETYEPVPIKEKV